MLESSIYKSFFSNAPQSSIMHFLIGTLNLLKQDANSSIIVVALGMGIV